MKHAVLASVAVLGLLLSASVLASAAYPAAYFQPKVIYSAEGLAANNTAPAATQPAASIPKSEVDPRYPAAYFEPKVIYSSK